MTRHLTAFLSGVMAYLGTGVLLSIWLPGTAAAGIGFLAGMVVWIRLARKKPSSSVAKQ